MSASSSSAERREIKALKSQVKRLEAANQEIDHLRAAFDALVVAHATSKAQRQEIASTLRHELQDSRHQASARQAELKSARKRVVDLAVCGRGRSQDRTHREVVEEAAWAARLDHYESTVKLQHAEKGAEEKRAGLDLVWAALQESESQRHALAEALRDTRRELSEATSEHKSDRELFKKERKGWTTALADRTHEAQAVQRHLKEELHFVKKQIKLSEQFSTMNELSLLGQLQASQCDLQYTETALQHATKANQELQTHAEDLHSQLKQESLDHKAVRAQLEEAQNVNKQVTCELQQERSDRKADWAAMQAQVDQLDEDKQKQTHRAVRAEESLGKLQKEMVLVRARERDLQDQVDSATDQLAELDGLRVAHTQLSTQLTEMAARNTLAESDSAALSNLNAQLLGHSNPHQKIVQVAKIRQELADIKKKYAMALAGLEAAKEENKELNDELDALRAINHGPGSHKSISTSAGPYDKLSRAAPGAGTTSIRRPPASVHRVLSDTTNSSSKRRASNATAMTDSYGSSSTNGSQKTSPATSLSSGTRVSLANVASAQKFKSFMR